MAKKGDKSLGSLAGFCRRGAHGTSPGHIPTGHFHLDFAIQYGMDPSKVDLSKIEGYDPSKTLGISLGTLVEIFGAEGSGKSSLAYRIAGYAQRMGHEVAWIDVEHSYQESLARLNGCDTNTLLYSNLINLEKPDQDFYAEHIFDNMIAMMKELNVKVIVLDSVANLVPKALYEADSEQQFMGLLSRMLSQNLGKLVSYAEKYGTLLIFINQLRENLSVGKYGDPETSPGGHSLKHNASLRLKVSKKTGKDANIFIPDPDGGEEEILIGRHSYVKIVKNRFAKPYLETLEVPIYYEQYFPEIEDIAFNFGRQIKLITVYKGTFSWGDVKVEGRQDFINHIVKNNLTDSLINDIKEKAEEKGVLLPPELSLYSSDTIGEDDVTGQLPGDDKKEDSGCGEDIPKKQRRQAGS